jgi:large subunit ribosomal protein L1
MSQSPKLALEQALDKIRKGKKTKFDQTIELHINLSLDPKQADQTIRFNVTPPHGTGKERKVAVVASGKISQADLELKDSDLTSIENGDLKPGKDFDVIVAEPRYMSKLAKLAKILGPAGMMPNPKAGTVTEDVAKTVEQIKKGRVEIRTEQNHPIVHTIIGKMSLDDNKLKDNFWEIINTLRQNKPTKAKPDFIKSVFISATMGKSYEIVLD